MKIDARNLHFKALNNLVRESQDSEIIIDNCVGQRYIADASGGKHITVNGTPGNALGAYMDGSTIDVYGNAQDATGDTMNAGAIVVHGSVGDACGYAMRGGKIFIKGNAGYRAGIHMKEYQEKKPVIVIGNETGSFLGEYQAGGIIIVLGLESSRKIPVGRFCGTGMHGGKMFIRCDEIPFDLPEQIVTKKADKEDLKEIESILKEYCKTFDIDYKKVLSKDFIMLTPDSKNPYHRLYTPN